VRFSIEFTGGVRRVMDNIILHIPHASLCLPPDFWRDITVDKEIIERELRFIADYKVDELVKNIDSHKIIAKYSRLYCDVERFRDDEAESMAKLGMGAIYTHLSDGTQYRKIESSRREEILGKSYDLHHKQLNALSRKIVDQYGSCVIIDIHSYSDRRVYLNGDTVSEKAVCNIDKIINFIAENLNPNPQPGRQNVARKVG